MKHNELVNIWTHLAGALVLMALIVSLTYSVTHYDSNIIKSFTGKEVNSYFNSIYQKFPNFTEFEIEFEVKYGETKRELREFSEKTLKTMEDSLQKITGTIENIKGSINSDAMKVYFSDINDQISKLPNIYSNLKDSIDASFSADIKKISDVTKEIKEKIKDLENHLIEKADSSEWDWIDFYKYLKHDESTTHQRMPSDPNHLSRWPIFVFLASAISCLLCSTIFHLFCCLNSTTNIYLQRLDYAGISFLISGSTFPPLVYGFYCSPGYSQFYLIVIAVACFALFVLSLGNWLHKSENATIKALLYGGLGCFAAIPLVHLVYLNLTNEPGIIDFGDSIYYYLLMGLSYLGGLTIYSMKCPERYRPGKHDICGHSHQLWHLCVLLGIFFSYLYSFDHYYSRRATSCVVQ